MSPAKVGALAGAYLVWLDDDDQRSKAWLRVSRALAERSQRGSHRYALGHEILEGIRPQFDTSTARDIWDELAMDAAEDVVKGQESSSSAFAMLSVIMTNPGEYTTIPTVPRPPPLTVHLYRYIHLRRHYRCHHDDLVWSILRSGAVYVAK
jgi:hypothetical protein